MKKLLITIITTLTALTAHALPGFTPALQDLPGQYVYYADNTFERQSYTGFMMFDSSTYAARYYAPADAKTKSPELDVELYFTLDPKADHIELTGERIIKGYSPEEAEFINYLHDMLYELNSRRVKTPEADSEKTFRKNDYFPQFGGSITTEYDQLIPLFNLRKIYQEESNPEFILVTAGQITDTNDRSFENFKGFPQIYDDIRHVMPDVKKSKSQIINTDDSQSFTLDTTWTQAMENVWMLGDSALVSVTALPDAPINFIKRQLLLSNGTSYLNWKDAKITENGDSLKIECVYYEPDKKNISRNFKLATKSKSGYKFFTMTVYNNVYSKNKKYFNKIIESYK